MRLFGDGLDFKNLTLARVSRRVPKIQNIKKHASGDARYRGENIIITNGFIKKTQKTPKSELAKALAYKRDYQARNLL